MGANERARERGMRNARRLAALTGEELRLRRLAVSLSQTAVAGAARTSRSKVSRIERGVAAHLALGDLFVLASVLGMDVSLRLYPVRSPLRDHGHHALLERLHARLSAIFRWRTEVPMPNSGDLRAWDAGASAPRLRVGIECEMRARDGQELERRVALKEQTAAWTA